MSAENGKKLTIDEARKLLDNAKKTNPGGWIEHSEYVGYVSGKIAEALGLDKEKAESFGLIHDIGRSVGKVNLRHVYEGYKILSDLGYNDAARICLTHSFFENTIEGAIGEWDLEEDKVQFVEDYIKNVKFDIYDRIVQVSDCISLSTGISIIERRMTDVFFRYGFNEYTEYNFKVRLDAQKELEDKLGFPLYKLFEKEISDNLSSKKVEDVVKFCK